MSVDTVMSGKVLRRVIDFNFFPSLEMDDSWWEPEWLPISLLTQVRSVKAAHRKLSDFILERYRIKHENYFDFGNYERRAALLSGIDLKALLYTDGFDYRVEDDSRCHREGGTANDKGIFGRSGLFIRIEK